jgi:hypothetical protein
MEFNGARMKQPRDFGGESARAHEDDILVAARRSHAAGHAAHRRSWRFWHRRGKHAAGR